MNFKRISSHPGGIKNSQTSLEISGVWKFGIFLSPRIPEFFSLPFFPEIWSNSSQEKQLNCTPSTAGILEKLPAFFWDSTFPDFWKIKIKFKKKKVKTREFNLGKKKTGKKTGKGNFVSRARLEFHPNPLELEFHPKIWESFKAQMPSGWKKFGLNRKIPDFSQF